ncbi:replication initiator protein [Dipodfec virus RodF1_74]|uniref:Replication initiator protein n=1 Tax=Dipodfec virus RodF1_74 TaxID=2929310 RepID=A0A976N2Y1_9VIRU|nr:replication initiator protein [Dipodfec virus RodF1_74]
MRGILFSVFANRRFVTTENKHFPTRILLLDIYTVGDTKYAARMCAAVCEVCMCCFPRWLPKQKIYVPCGECVECMRTVSNEWALRICLECQQHAENCCVTLTYDEAHKPQDSLLQPRDMQLWLKRLRKAVSPVRVRFFGSGEYGDKFWRPHYHVILFGWRPPDLVPFFVRNGRQFYKSEFVSDTWRNGHILVGDVDFHTAFYTAKYLQKAMFKDVAVPPFVRMSNRPGIGAGAVDTVNFDFLVNGKIYFDGKAFNVPRYFWKLLEKADSDIIDWQEWHDKRALKSKLAHEAVPFTDFEKRRKRSDDFFKGY